MFGLQESYTIKRKRAGELFKEQRLEIPRTDDKIVLPQMVLDPKNPCLNLGSNAAKVNGSSDDLYEFNSGTTLTLTVNNKIIIAGDTRHSSEYSINSRKMTKIYRLGNFYLTTAGFFADGFEIYTKLHYQIKMYESYNKMPLNALAHLLHNILYSRRFFPLYSYTCLSGYEDGMATIYTFDAVGNYQKTACRCDGSGSAMIQPLLDSWISRKNFENYSEISFDDAVKLVKKAFDGISERDIKTKDNLEIYILDGDNVDYQIIPLRID